MSSLSEQTQLLLNILHQGSTHRFIQNIVGSNRRTKWFTANEPVVVPSDWFTAGNVYFGVHGTTVRITDKDREKPWTVGKSDSYIEQRVASKNETIEATNCVYSEFDGKDYTYPTKEEINAKFALLRADPAKQESSDKELENEAIGAAKLAKYITDPARYKALAFAHVQQLEPKPSAVWDSGGGFQTVWLYKETCYIRTAEDREHAKSFQARWVEFVGGDLGAKDLRRVLRTPDTYNNKKAYAPNFPPVKFIHVDFNLRYTQAELEALLPAPEVKSSEAKRQTEPAALTPLELQAKSDSLISLFNAMVDIRDLLLRYGYTDEGDRFSRPGEPASRGVEFDANNRARFWSGNDPLHDPHWYTAFDVWCKLEFEGDTNEERFGQALQALKHGIFPDLRLWARTTSFKDYINPANLRSDGTYRTDSTDTKVFDTMLDVYEKVGGLGATVSRRIGAREAGVSASAFIRSLQRMGEFFEVTLDEKTHCFYVRLRWENTELAKRTTYSLLKIIGDRLSGSSRQFEKNTPVQNDYSPHKADEPFLIGTSRFIRQRMEDLSSVLGISPEQAKADYTFSSLGEVGIRLIDALIRLGDGTAYELADETGKTLAGVQGGLRKLSKHGLVEAEREGSHGRKCYTLADEIWLRIDELAPNLRTYKMRPQREEKRLEQAQRWTVRGYAKAIQDGDDEKAQALEHRYMHQASKRMNCLVSIHGSDLLIDNEAIRQWEQQAEKDPVTHRPLQQAPKLTRRITVEEIADIYQVYSAINAYKYATVDPTDSTLAETYQRDPSIDLDTERMQATNAHREDVKAIREAALQAAQKRFDLGLKRPGYTLLYMETMRLLGFNKLPDAERELKAKQVRSVLSSSEQMKSYWQMASDPARAWNINPARKSWLEYEQEQFYQRKATSK